MRAALALLLLVACGGGDPEGAMGRDGERASQRRPLELALRKVDGTFFEVGEQRGKPVLVFVFATFDGVSQAALDPLRRFVEAHGDDVLVVGIAAQPNARELLDAYVHALEPPFVATYDPEERITSGSSDLEDITTVPTYVMLDARGIEVARQEGLAQLRRLDEMLAAVRVRHVDQDEAPLIGTSPR